MIDNNLLRLQKSDMKVDKLSKKERTKVNNEVSRLRSVLVYLQSDPSEEFLIKTKRRLERSIKSIKDNYEYWFVYCHGGDLNDGKEKSRFDKETGLPQLKRNLKNVKFILEE